jgi:hypothetical protein
MRAAKVDRNQSEIVTALRAVGCRVQLLHMVGGGCPDLIVAFRGGLLFLECKDGKLPPSARKLTPEQVEWHDLWRDYVVVVSSVKEALEAVGVPYRGEVS